MEITLVSSRIDSVTAYRKGARVHRVAELHAANGSFPAQIRLAHLPLAMDDASLKVRICGAGGSVPVASDLRVTLEIPPPDPALAPAEDAALRAARNGAAKLRDRLEQNRSETARLEAIALPPRGKEKDAKSPIPVPTDARVKLLEFRLEGMEALLKEKDALEIELAEADRKLRDLEAKFAKASTARQPREHELRKAVIVSLRSMGVSPMSNAVQLELEYLIPGARWAPAYTFRFDRDFTRAELSMRALVAQKTGEDWAGAKLVLSTANAQGWTELDELSSLRIGRKQQPVARKGWRPAPDGAGELYADYDRSVAREPKRSDTVLMPPSLGNLIGAQAACQLLGVNQTQLTVMVARGELKSYRQSGEMLLSFDDIRNINALAGTEPAIMVGAAAGRGGAPNDIDLNQVVLEDIELMPTDDAAGTQQVTIQAKSESLDANLRYRSAKLASAPPPPPAAAEAPMMRASMAMSRVQRAAAAPGSFGKPQDKAPEAADLSSETTILHRELSPSDQMLNYGRLRMPPPVAHQRGRLEYISDEALYVEMLAQLNVEVSFSVTAVVAHAIALAHGIEQRSPPLRCRFPETLDGFDYAYTTPSPVDIPSDGEFHSIPLVCETADARSNFVCVPREVLDVFRFAEIKNPLGAPLLEGPADIHAGGDFLMTTAMHTVAPYGQIRLGLGVEQSIKVARNTSYSEDAAGIIGGSLDLKHELKVDVISHLKQPVQVEVRERIPVLREGEDQAKLTTAQVSPEWEALKPESLRPGEESLKGGYRWLVTAEPGKPKHLKATYVIQISAKNEISGGNRREA